jgi:hypothetical protein
MSLLELGRRLQNQAPQRRLGRRKISLKNISNAKDVINTLARRIKNMQIRLVKKAHSNQHHKTERKKAGYISTYPEE